MNVALGIHIKGTNNLIDTGTTEDNALDVCPGLSIGLPKSNSLDHTVEMLIAKSLMLLLKDSVPSKLKLCQ